VGLELIRGPEQKVYRKDPAGSEAAPGESAGSETARIPLATLFVAGLLAGLLFVLLAFR